MIGGGAHCTQSAKHGGSAFNLKEIDYLRNRHKMQFLTLKEKMHMHTAANIQTAHRTACASTSYKCSKLPSENGCHILLIQILEILSGYHLLLLKNTPALTLKAFVHTQFD